MIYTLLNKDILKAKIYKSITKIELEERDVKIIILPFFIKIDDHPYLIKKIFRFVIRNNNNNIYTIINYKNYKFSTSDHDTTKYTNVILNELNNLQPCTICLKISNKSKCHKCKRMEICNFSVFNEDCGICLKKIHTNAKIMNCCSKLMHKLCYKKYYNVKSHQNNFFCDECEESIVNCLYCRECISCHKN